MHLDSETASSFKHHDVEPGKLPNRPKVIELNSLSAAQPPTINTKPLLHVRDEVSNTLFLVDTGAEVSLLPPTRPDLAKAPSMNLVAANGSAIKSYGTRLLELRINHNKYTWRFQVADVHKPIIGADFLRSHSLLVDLTNKKLLRLDNLAVLNGIVKEVPTNVCNITRAPTMSYDFTRLLKDRPATP